MHGYGEHQLWDSNTRPIKKNALQVSAKRERKEENLGSKIEHVTNCHLNIIR